MIERWAGFVIRRTRSVLVVGLLIVVVAGAYGAGVFGSLAQGGFDTPGSESDRALNEERAIFGNRAADVIVIYSDDERSAMDPGFRAAVKKVVDDLPKDAIARVTPYYDTEPAAGMITRDRRGAQVVISLAGSTQSDYLRNYEKIKDGLTAEGLRTDVAGPYAVFSDINQRVSDDLKKAELVATPLLLELALLIFGSFVAALMPVLIGLVALVGRLAVTRALAGITDVSVFSVNVISVLGIGLAIDYSLFVVSRFREELARLPADHPNPSSAAIARTLTTAGRTVLFSGLTVAVSLASLLVFPQMFLRSMSYGGVAAVVLAMIATLTVLPAVLVLLGRRIDSGRPPWRRAGTVGGPDLDGRWAAIARAVMRRPIGVLVATVALLLIVASPFLGVKWGGVDHRVLPADSPAYIATAKLKDFPGAAGATGSADVLLQGTNRRSEQRYLAAVNGLADRMTAVVVARKGDDALIQVSWPGDSQSGRSRALLTELRDLQPTRGSATVGGPTASLVDLLGSVSSRLPWMGVIVVVVMFALLFMAFGSVVLPVKAVLMNVFSITASFGVVTWISVMETSRDCSSLSRSDIWR